MNVSGMTMRRIVSAVLLLAASSSVAADFSAGVEAYLRGDYAAALREFRPLPPPPVEPSGGRCLGVVDGLEELFTGLVELPCAAVQGSDLDRLGAV